MLKMAQVVVSEGDRNSLISSSIAHFSGSWATHTFMATGGGKAIEAWLPKVRVIDVQRRLDQLKDSDRAFVVLDLRFLNVAGRIRVRRAALRYLGQSYSWGQVLTFALTGSFPFKTAHGVVCSKLISSAYLTGTGVNLFAGVTANDRFNYSAARLADLRNGYAVPRDLLNSCLEVVDFYPSSRITTIEQFRR